jgi:hypothetical protein
MKNPKNWSKADLHHHLQHAIDLEFWTIPLYLTALYSIKNLKGMDKKNYPEAAKLIESVVIQEMLHLEIACNLCNALGYSPQFSVPVYDNRHGIPFIHPHRNSLPDELHGYEIKPGALNENTLKLFCAIELPETRRHINWADDMMCESIAQLYDGLQIFVQHNWSKFYVGDKNNTRQKFSFKEYQSQSGRHHGFSQIITSAATAFKAIEAIIEQGEGSDAKYVKADFRPPELEEGKEFDAGWYKGNLSHYQKFRILFHHHKKLPEVYLQASDDGKDSAQLELKNCFLNFLYELETSFNTEGYEMPAVFWKSMFALQDSIIAVWESGKCPDFNFT